MKQALVRTNALPQKLPIADGHPDELRSSEDEVNRSVLKDVLVLTYPKSFWASPESHIFPNRCEMRWKWGHSTLRRNAILYFFQAIGPIWRVHPKILYFGASGRLILIFIWLKKRGFFRDTKFIVTNNLFFNKHDAQFIDRIIVYTHSDIIGRPEKYQARYRFIPLPADGDFKSIESHDGNYIFSGGGEGRDFKSLIEAAAGTPYTLKIVSFSRALLEYPDELPENIQFYGFMPLQDYLGMIANATCVVIPLKHGNHPHGHTSIIQAFSLGKAVITTKGASCEDYAQDRRNALLVAPGDIAGYRAAIQELCENVQLRQTIEQQARQDAEQRFTYRHFAKHAVALCEELLSV